MHRLGLVLFILLACVAKVHGQPAAACRVSVPDGGGVYSHGSGTLVEFDEHRFVLTNWHVVRDAVGPPTLQFLHGEKTGGKVLAKDQTWDLAIVEPDTDLDIEPLRLADKYPKPGERVWCGGFGPNNQWRHVVGPVQGFTLNPANNEADWLFASGSVRQGDSGGPIINERGELAGVLWGTDGSDTYGTQCLRIAKFCQCIGGSCRIWRGNQESGRVVQGNQQQPTTQTPQSKPKPQPPATRPTTPQVDPSRLDKLEQALARIETELAKRPNVSIPGPPGPIGPQGIPGPMGPRGPAGQVPTEINVDIDQITAEVVKRLPPSPAYFSIEPRKQR